MVTLTYTYEIVTPESAEQGDFSEHGWWMPGGWEHALCDEDGYHEDTLSEAKAGAFAHVLSARECVDDIRRTLSSFECELNGNTLRCSECDGDIDPCTGASTRRDAHIDGNPRLLRAMLVVLTGKHSV